MSDLHIDLVFKLHLVSNSFHISKIRFSLGYIARGVATTIFNWKQEIVVRQTTSSKVMSIRLRTTSK